MPHIDLGTCRHHYGSCICNGILCILWKVIFYSIQRRMSNPNRPGIKEIMGNKISFHFYFCKLISQLLYTLLTCDFLCLLEAFPEGRVSFEIGPKTGTFCYFYQGKFLHLCLIFPCHVWHIFYSKNRISNVCECIRGRRRPLMKTYILFLRAHICRRT